MNELVMLYTKLSQNNLLFYLLTNIYYIIIVLHL
jgi:hypothetical protein